MSKTNICKINFTISSKNFRSKSQIAIDMFNEKLKKIAMEDNVEIEIKCNEYILEMKAKAYDVVVQYAIQKNIIVDNIFDVKKIKSIAEYAYRVLRLLLVEKFEEIEYNQEKDGNDENWEFLELCGM